MTHQPLPYPIRLPPQVGIVFNCIDRLDLGDGEVALHLCTRPLPSFRYVLWWCEPAPTLISFPLPDDGEVGHYWTTYSDEVTLPLFPEDVLIVPLQRPTGTWYKPSTVTCNVVLAIQALQSDRSCTCTKSLYGLGKEAFAELMRLQQGKARVTALARAGRTHALLDSDEHVSPRQMS